MIISCPQCETSYNIPEDSLRPDGRKVRCSSCSHRWQVHAPPVEEHSQVIADDEAIDPLLAETDADGIDQQEDSNSRAPKFHPANPATGKVRTRTSLKAIAGWFALLLVVASLAAFVLARHQVAQALPFTKPIYSLLGLGENDPLHLRLSDVGSEEIIEEGRAVIVISGLVINEGAAAESVPDLHVSLLDSMQSEITTGIFGTLETELESGGITTFEARFPDPPDEAKLFSVSFGGHAETKAASME